MKKPSQSFVNAFLSSFINAPKLGHLVMILVFLLGIMSLFALRYEVMPKIEMGIVKVTTFKPGAGPEEIELAITTPLEEEILKVNGVNKVVSNSMENLSLITIQLDPNADDEIAFRALADIQRAIDRAHSRLPSDLLEKPLVEKISTENLAVAEIHITGAVSEKVLRQQARIWQQKLRALPEVAGVDRVGYRRAEISIEPDQHKLWQLGISYSEIQRALELRNVRDSAGSLTSVVGEKQVLTVGQFQQPKDIGNVIIRSRGPGNDIALRDIAQVMSSYEDWDIQVRSDGQASIALLVKKHGKADELKTLNAIKQLIATTALPPGVELKTVNDVSRFTLDMLNTLITNALLGFASVFIILWLFLGNKMAFWVSVGLPFSIFAAFSGMLFLGLSVNSLTLMSMILVLGMLVDDAIVTGEAIQARKEQGLECVPAALQGTKDIAAPVFVSVLTTVLAFLPIAFLGGLEGKFVSVIPIVVGLTLLASLFESKFLLPAHLAHSNFEVNTRGWLERVQATYRHTITYLLVRRKWAAIGMVTAFLIVTVASASVVRFQLYPETAVDTIQISVELQNGTAFDETVRKVEQLEQAVKATVPASDLLNVISQIGHHDTDLYGSSMGRNSAWALVTVYLKPQNKVKQDQRKTLQALKSMAETLDGFPMLRVEPISDAPIIGKPVEIEIMSEGKDKFHIATQVKTFLSKVPGVTDIWDSETMGKTIVELVFNYQALAAYGLNVKQVADAVRVSMDGLLVLEQQLAEERVFFRMRLPTEQRETAATLKALYIVNDNGHAVALSAVADLRLRPGEAAIKKHNGRRTITVYADIDRAVVDVVKINEKLKHYLIENNFSADFPSVSFYQGGELEQHSASYQELGIAFVVCLMLIFFVLVVLFNSFSQPLLVMAVLPFSIMGVFLTFAVQGLPLSFLALIGVLGLIGVLINDAVVMIFTLNQSAHRGNPKKVAELATKRFRPIVITSLTTLAGLIPTAYGLGGYNPFIAPMVMTMAWGVAIGTVISLLLLPCLFMLNDDIRQAVSRLQSLTSAYFFVRLKR